MTNIFPTLNSSSHGKIISSNNILPIFLDNIKISYLANNLWSARLYIHKFNIETKKHEIIIKHGIANSYFINENTDLNNGSLTTDSIYVINCHVIKNFSITNKKIYNFTGIFYNSINDVPNILWSSDEYNKGKIKFIVIEYNVSPYKTFLFKTETDCINIV